MSDPKPQKTTRQIVVSADAWDKAKKMAGLRRAKDQEGDEIGAVTTDAILAAWEQLPVEVREFLERPEPEAQPV
jgi:hypothetical protein